METTEKSLLVILISISSLMLLRSWRYSPEARIFPQVTAVVTLLFSIIIVVQSWMRSESSADSNLISSAQERVSDVSENTDSKSSDSAVQTADMGKAEPGEFRISQPTSRWNVPYTNRAVSKRLALAGLLIMYLLLLWLFGLAVSSIVFVIGCSVVLDIPRNVSIGLLVFTVMVLVAFERWFVTPLFRTGHNMFDLAGALPI